MSEHRYPRRVLMADYARAGAGLALTAGPLAAVSMSELATAVLGGSALLFAVFGLRTALRQASRVVADETGLRVEGPVAKRLAWEALSDLRLRYFAVRRDRQAGWMQLTLKAPGVAVRLDSTIEGFPALARRAASAADENGLRLDRGTLDNLRAFGVTFARERKQEKAGREGSP